MRRMAVRTEEEPSSLLSLRPLLLPLLLSGIVLTSKSPLPPPCWWMFPWPLCKMAVPPGLAAYAGVVAMDAEHRYLMIVHLVRMVVLTRFFPSEAEVSPTASNSSPLSLGPCADSSAMARPLVPSALNPLQCRAFLKVMVDHVADFMLIEKDEAVESWIVDNYLLGTFTRALRDKWPQLEHCSEIRPPLPEGADGYDIFANGDIGWDNLGVALARVMAHSRTCWEEGED